MTCQVYLLLAFCLFTVNARPNPEFIQGGAEMRITGGRDAQPGGYPWMLSLQKYTLSWTHTCGAVILNNQYGLTSCHCVNAVAAQNLRVVAGLYDLTSMAGTQTVGIESYTMHPSYNTGVGTSENDIAVIRYTGQMNVGESGIMQPTYPPDNSNNYAGQNARVIGWGQTASGSLSSVLQEAQVSVLTTSDCNLLMGSQATITDNHICADDPSNLAGACPGDGGGPLNSPNAGGTGYIVTGIGSFVVSFGGVCNGNYPSVYTRVGAYLDWIISEIS